MPTAKSELTQQQLLRQRLLPQQLRYAAMLEETHDEMEREVELELQENPALERVQSHDAADEHRYYNPSPRHSTEPEIPLADPDTPTLAQYLQQQLAEMPQLDPTLKDAAEYIADTIDPNGYMTRTVPQLADDMGIDDLDAVRRAVALLQSLDPPGVAATDLRQSIVLQLKRLPADTPAIDDALEVARYFFDLYGARSFDALQRESGLTSEQLREADRLIASLNPKPGAAFSRNYAEEAATAAVRPDFAVETDGERATVSFANTLPQLQVEESFSMADNGPGEEFVAAKRREAETFIDLLRRRQDTLLHIARAIVRHQSAFFISGDDETQLRPMVLRDIADRTGLGLSVVSRAIRGKWLATAWGVYPLKHFFSHRKKEEQESGLSTHAVIAAMRTIIDSEPPSKPLSDQAIADAMTAQGIPTARRTVTKYRTRLGIPSAAMRRSL